MTYVGNVGELVLPRTVCSDSCVVCVLILDLTFFIKLNISHSKMYCQILTVLTKCVFIQTDTVIATKVCRPCEIRRRATG
jgi:hypothetical protein